ncbi:MAG: DinB family protein [Gemmatimonadales bacterium]
MKRAILLLFVLSAVPAAAQQTVSGVSAVSAVGVSPDLAVSTAKGLWEQMTGFIAKAAEQVPEADYAFRPTPEVRTFGQLIGHVAGAQAMFCAAALGEKPGNEDEVEKSATTKSALIAALRTTSQGCQRAYAQSDAASAGMTTLFGGQSTRLRVLMMNATHNAEHYGNIVTYMRIKGMVPPSSQPAPPRM